jgi:ribose transport system permease protein
VEEEGVSRAAQASDAKPTERAEAAAERRRALMNRLNSILARYGLLLAFAAMIIGFSLAKPDAFPTTANLKSILTAAAPALIVAAGLTVPLVMQDFDLSFGAMIGLAGGAAVVLQSQDGWAWGLAVLVALGLGLGAGLANGFLIAYLGGSSFIITLAMGTVLVGMEYVFTDQKTIFSGVSEGYVNIGQEEFLGLNNQIWIAGVIALLLWVMLDQSELGRYMYAIGGNPEAARLSGVRIRRIRLTGFVVVALCAAIVGILLTAQAASSVPNTGVPYLLPAFAAVFLGSAVFRPGEFNIPGTVVGVLFLGVIQTGLTMLQLETFVINLVQGAILIVAVLVSQLGQRTA